MLTIEELLEELRSHLQSALNNDPIAMEILVSYVPNLEDNTWLHDEIVELLTQTDDPRYGTALFLNALQFIEYEEDQSLSPSAVVLFEKAIEAGSGRALGMLALLYYRCCSSNLNVESSRKSVVKLTELLNRHEALPEAKGMLGYLHHMGQLFPRNLVSAKKYYLEAISLNNAFAMYSYSRMICETSKDEANRLCEQAAKLGNIDSMRYLAEEYAQKQQYNDAIAILEKALTISPFNTSLLCQCADMYFVTTQDMSVEQIEQNREEAIELLNRAVNLGDISAMTTLANVHSNGENASYNDEALTPHASATQEPSPSSTEAQYRKMLLLKKLGLADEGISIKGLLQAYVNAPRFSNRHHKLLIHHFLSLIDSNDPSHVDDPAKVAEYLRDQTHEHSTIGTFALMLRYFDALKPSSISPSSALKKKMFMEKSFYALVDKLGLKPEVCVRLNGKMLAEKIISAYITPPSFLGRFNNRHHAALMTAVGLRSDAREYYDAIRDKILDENISINPQGTLAMLLNALQYIADYLSQAERIMEDVQGVEKESYHRI